MPEYRIFHLDNAGKVLGPSEKITFDNDPDAIRETRKNLDGVTFEVWDGMRRIAVLKPNQET
jgi:hypothetical protein